MNYKFFNCDGNDIETGDFRIVIHDLDLPGQFLDTKSRRVEVCYDEHLHK